MPNTKLPLEKLAEAWLPLNQSALAPKLMQQIAPAIRIIAVAGVREDMTAGRSPDGTPYAPLKHTRPDGGDRPLRDKGLLAASISATQTQNDIELKASHPGANIHQYGGTITAKKKFLTIPVTAEAKRAGGAKKFPRSLFFIMGRATDTAVLCERAADVGQTSRGAGLKVHYVLKRSVRVTARPFLGFSMKTELRIVQLVADKAQALIAATVEASMGGGASGVSGISGSGR